MSASVVKVKESVHAIHLFSGSQVAECVQQLLFEMLEMQVVVLLPDSLCSLRANCQKYN